MKLLSVQFPSSSDFLICQLFGDPFFLIGFVHPFKKGLAGIGELSRHLYFATLLHISRMIFGKGGPAV